MCFPVFFCNPRLDDGFCRKMWYNFKHREDMAEECLKLSGRQLIRKYPLFAPFKDLLVPTPRWWRGRFWRRTENIADAP